MVGTLNRVMIVELQVPSAVVAVMVSLPVLWAPLRALIGFRSDHHRSALGWRRVPYIWMGTLIQFGGLAVMPWALLVLSGGDNSANWPAWLGPLGAGLAFLLVGAGVHVTQTAGLALATDLAPTESHPKVVGLMYVMLLAGSMVSAFIFGAMLTEFSPARLIQVIQASAVITLVLNTVSLWKQETRRPARLRGPDPAQTPSFRQAWQELAAEPQARLRLGAIGLGTMAFAMQDVLLEPFGGQVLAMSVGGTTWLSATLALGGLLGFGLASRWLANGWVRPLPLAMAGVWLGVPAFGAVIVSATLPSTPLFVMGAFFIGCGAGLFGHGTLTATMQAAPKGKEGLALGAWGAVQATAAGVAVATGGVLRDVGLNNGRTRCCPRRRQAMPLSTRLKSCCWFSPQQCWGAWFLPCRPTSNGAPDAGALHPPHPVGHLAGLLAAQAVCRVQQAQGGQEVSLPTRRGAPGCVVARPGGCVTGG